MKRLVDLGFLFRAVAVLELGYFLAGMMPPSLVHPATGWVLGPDGQWVTKLMGVALLTQAWIAWMFRKRPHLGVARALALYQLASATVDWVMWLAMSDAGIFSNTQARVIVVAAIASHYTLGLLLVVAIARTRPTAAPASSGKETV